MKNRPRNSLRNQRIAVFYVKCMFSKKAVVVSTAAGAGAKTAVRDIKTALFYWGIPYIKSYGAALQAMNWDMVSEEKKEKNISTLAPIWIPGDKYVTM